MDSEFFVKKLFIETGLNSAESLIYHFENIEDINEYLYK